MNEIMSSHYAVSILEKNYYWADHYDTSYGYVELNFRNILFVTIFCFSDYNFFKFFPKNRKEIHLSIW